jgi:sulfonate dioxygenase
VYDEKSIFPPTELFEFHDRGLDADKKKPHLFEAPGATFSKLTPRIGTEVSGLQLSQLTDAQKNELALLIAERGVVVFRDQDFKSIGPEKQKDFGSYFGKLHVHVSTNLI